MNAKDLAEAFDGDSSEVEETELDAEEPDDTEADDAAASADAAVFFDDTEDHQTRYEALRRMVRRLK